MENFPTLDFFDSYNVDFLKARAGRVSIWSALDSESRYNSKISTNKKLITFRPGDVNYQFNSHGFRCNDFDNTDKVKILYSGCSHTEGVGTPLELTWPSQLNKLISNETQQKVNYYNVAGAGASSNSAIRMVYVTVRSGIFVPDMVMMLLPSPLQVEFIKEYQSGCLQPYNFSSIFEQKSTGFGLVDDHSHALNYSTAIQMLYNTLKDLIFLADYLKEKGIPCFFDTWYPGKFRLLKNSDEAITYFDLLQNHTSKIIKGSFVHGDSINEGLVVDSFDQRVEFKDRDWPIDIKKPYAQNVARDGYHFGPNIYWLYANEIFNELKKKPKFIGLLDSWKAKQ